MTYELAKQLKDAGFPFNLDARKSDEALYVVGEVPLRSPTLSELIEACGEEIMLTNANPEGQWSAYKSGQVSIAQFYSTPDEAVAQLYLKLHEK